MRLGQASLPLEMRKGNGLGEGEVNVEVCVESVSRNRHVSVVTGILSIGWLYSGPTLRAAALCRNATAAQVLTRIFVQVSLTDWNNWNNLT